MTPLLVFPMTQNEYSQIFKTNSNAFKEKNKEDNGGKISNGEGCERA
jgi:hypothetical protein